MTTGNSLKLTPEQKKVIEDSYKNLGAETVFTDNEVIVIFKNADGSERKASFKNGAFLDKTNIDPLKK